VATLRAAYPSLPEDYFAFLARSDGAEGDLGVEPGWFQVWPAADAAAFSSEYQVPEYLPGFFAFGGNGGGELFVLTLSPPDGSQPVLMVPAIGMEPSSLIQVASSFAEFTTHMGQVSPDD
jgi:SMI1 / KNR4 family (SUKH-1)